MHAQNKKYGNFVSTSCFTGKCAAQIKKKIAVLFYGHAYIIWSYSEAKIKLLIFQIILARLYV